MPCPFLHEVEVDSCLGSPVRKLIVAARTGCEPICTSEAHAGCRVFRAMDPDGVAAPQCPFLRHSLMQYCSAAPTQKLVPYSESLLSRCGTSRYRYCDVYLALEEAGERVSEPEVEGIRVPRNLAFSANHMWIETDDQGSWHLGLDGFATRVLGHVESLTFVTEGGSRRPAVALRANGVDMTFTFPVELPIDAVNVYLRGNPAKLTAAPYTMGWIFEGSKGPAAASGLIRYPESIDWMRSEVDRLSRVVHATAGGLEPADGGGFSPDFLGELSRDATLRLFHDFFSLQARPL